MSIPRWQYRAIALNIQAPPRQRRSGAAEAGASSPSPGGSEGLFSRSFLESQFPEYYGPDAPKEAGKRKRGGGLPELIELFNRLGSDGWEFVSREEIGGFNLLLFRRPLAGSAPPPSSEGTSTPTDP